MQPYLKITIKTATWPYLWVKFVRGFSPRQCCAKCLVGRYWDRIPFAQRRAGDTFEGALAFTEPLVYVCGVNRRGYDFNLHLPLERNPRCRWTHETEDILVEASGLWRLLPIPPLPEDVLSLVSPRQARCRNYRFGAATWPEQLRSAAMLWAKGR